MIALLTVLACSLPLPQERTVAEPPAPSVATAALTTPAQSLAARPRWVPHKSYAPTASSALLEQGTRVQGEVDGGLVICEVRSDIEEQRLTRKARAPDLQGTLHFGDIEAAAINPDNLRTMVISAPLAHLTPGDILRIRVRDRQLLRVRDLGVLETGYVGLPTTLSAPALSGRCEWVPRPVLEDALPAPTQHARRELKRWAPAPSLEDDTLALPEPAREARAAIQQAASLVGWADARVTPLVQQFDDRLAQREAALGRQVAQRREDATRGQPTSTLAWSTAHLLATPDAVRAALGDTVPIAPVIALPVQAEAPTSLVGGSIGSVTDLEYIDLHGAHWPLSAWGFRQGQDAARMADQVSGRAQVILQTARHYMGAEPSAPGLLRGRVDGEWVFLRVEER